MIVDKDHDTAEEGLQKQSSCSQAYGFATITVGRGSYLGSLFELGDMSRDSARAVL
jgi:hypothetical protein